jgi:hypothetical protein
MIPSFSLQTVVEDRMLDICVYMIAKWSLGVFAKNFKRSPRGVAHVVEHLLYKYKGQVDLKYNQAGFTVVYWVPVVHILKVKLLTTMPKAVHN